MRYKNLENILNRDGIVFLSYGGFLTQTLISGMTEALEKEVECTDLKMKVSHNIFTIFIELSQNIMNYTKSHPELTGTTHSNKSLIIVGQDNATCGYYVVSRNLVHELDKQTIESKLKAIEGLDKESLRQLYRDKRKQNRDKENQGAGIGFIEVARRCDTIEHHFEQLQDNKYNFTIKAAIQNS